MIWCTPFYTMFWKNHVLAFTAYPRNTWVQLSLVTTCITVDQIYTYNSKNQVVFTLSNYHTCYKKQPRVTYFCLSVIYGGKHPTKIRYVKMKLSYVGSIQTIYGKEIIQVVRHLSVRRGMFLKLKVGNWWHCTLAL